MPKEDKEVHVIHRNEYSFDAYKSGKLINRSYPRRAYLKRRIGATFRFRQLI
jgi:hypothetical protein